MAGRQGQSNRRRRRVAGPSGAPRAATGQRQPGAQRRGTQRRAPSGGGQRSGAPVAARTSTSRSVRRLDAPPAGQPFKIEFDNKDAGTPHNVAIHQGSASGTEVFKGEIFPGVATKTYDVPALTAGSYTFVCTVHPTMTGTLTVQ